MPTEGIIEMRWHILKIAVFNDLTNGRMRHLINTGHEGLPDEVFSLLRCSLEKAGLTASLGQLCFDARDLIDSVPTR